MKAISDFTIYCTKEQTLKAIELGAGIDNSSSQFDSDCTDNIELLSNGLYAIIPTSEQMCGWLRTEGVHLSILYSKFRNLYSVQCVEFDGMYIRDDDGSIKYFISDKQATLAAIDAALDYLTNNKK